MDAEKGKVTRGASEASSQGAPLKWEPKALALGLTHTPDSKQETKSHPSPWPIHEWSWIIPAQSTGGCFVPQTSLTLRWCSAARLGFSGECAREGPSQEGEALFRNSMNRGAGKKEAWKLRWMPWQGLIACVGYCKVHLVPPPKRLYPCPPPVPSKTIHHKEFITHHQRDLVSFIQGCSHTSLLRKHSQSLSAKCLRAGEPVGVCRRTCFKPWKRHTGKPQACLTSSPAIYLKGQNFLLIFNFGFSF